MNSFTATLVATAALSSAAMAQLPRECFFATQMHGTHDADSDLLSDLPTLMQRFEPGMRLQTITAFQDPEDDDRLSGLQTTLFNDNLDEELTLPVVGAITEDYDVEEVDLLPVPADRISFLADEGGVCDIVIYQGHKATYLSHKEDSECRVEIEGVYETMLRIPAETPLVGFHGMSSGYGMESIGAIFLDTLSPMCQHASYHDLSEYKGMNVFEASKLAEGGMTAEEWIRAKALETILKYDSVLKARQSKEQVYSQIKNLLNQEPIKTVNGEPASVIELQKVMDRLHSYKVDARKPTADRFAQLWEELMHLHDQGTSAFYTSELPVTVGELKAIYDHLATKLGEPANSYEGKPLYAKANTAELYFLLELIGDHYEVETNELHDLDASDDDMLMELFGQLAEHYDFLQNEDEEDDYDDEEEDYGDEAEDQYKPNALVQGPPSVKPPPTNNNTQELSQVYSELSKMLGKGSEFALEERQVEQMYTMLKNDQRFEARLEGEMIQGFRDLLELESKNKVGKIQDLFKELRKYENLEEESQSFFEGQSDKMESEVGALFSKIEGEEERIMALENMLRASQNDSQRQAEFTRNAFKVLSDQIGSFDHARAPLPAPGTEIRADELYDMQHAPAPGTKVSASELYDMQHAPAPGTNVRGFGPQVSSESTQDSITEEMKNEAHELLLAFAAVFSIALFLGTCVGAICIYSIRCCCRDSQKKRLEKAQNEPGNTFHFRSQSSASQNTIQGDHLAVPTRDAKANLPGVSPVSPQEMLGVSGSGELSAYSPNMKQEEDFSKQVKTVTEQTEDEESDEEAEPGFLSARGLKFEAPAGRRATFQKKLSGLSASKNNVVKAGSKRDLYNM